MERILEYIIEKDFDNENIKTFLKCKLLMSNSLINHLKQSDDGITVNNTPRHVRHILKSGDVLRLIIRENRSDNIAAQNIPLDIIYEDDDIIIINKTSNMPVHTSPGHYYDTVSNAVMYHYGSQDITFHAVNRLDKDTSGLMCIAKHKYAHALLCKEIKENKLKRKYTAIVCGNVKKDDTICAPISRESVIKRCVDENGQFAVTHFRIINQLKDYSVLELELETGRTHQIRVHMSFIGHPLLGDWLYGTENKELFPRQALHSSYLELTHPITKESLTFTAPIPSDMNEFILSHTTE